MRTDIKNYFKHSGNRAFFEISLYLFVASLPFGHGIDALLLGVLAISWLMVSDWKSKLRNLRRHRVSALLIFALYLLVWVGMLWSENIGVALGRAERSTALIVLPLILLSLDGSLLDLKRIFYALGIGLGIVMVISWMSVLADILSKPWPLRQAKYFFQWIYTDENLLRAVDIHPGYFVLFLVLFLVQFIVGPELGTIRRKTGLFYLFLFLLLLFLVETSSRIGFVSLILIVLIESFRRTSKSRQWGHWGIILVLILVATQFQYLGSKFDKLIDAEGNITFERYHRWRAIWTEFSAEHSFLLGVGSGDVYEVYDQAYDKGGFTLASEENYNAHNQYLELLVGTGIFGMIIYLLLLGHFAYKTRLRGGALAFIVLILIFSFTESYLIRAKGVFFFAFFYALYINTSKRSHVSQ